MKTVQTPADAVRTLGLLGSWTLNCSGDTIQAVIGNPTAAPVPGTLVLLAGGAAGLTLQRRRAG